MISGVVGTREGIFVWWPIVHHRERNLSTLVLFGETGKHPHSLLRFVWHRGHMTDPVRDCGSLYAKQVNTHIDSHHAFNHIQPTFVGI